MCRKWCYAINLLGIKCNTFAMVYKFLKLVLLLSLATASVERVFSDMKVVKSITYVTKQVING